MKFSNLKIGLLITCFLLSATVFGQVKKVSGTVTSEEDGKPLVGVTITLKGKTREHKQIQTASLVLMLLRVTCWLLLTPVTSLKKLKSANLQFLLLH